MVETLRRVHDDKGQAAALLGIDLSTLYRKLKRYGH
ncbi:MAG: helix-turn-helix domain-containing protein [Acidobacteriota bacterium]